MEEEEITPEMINDMEALQEDQTEDSMDDRQEMTDEQLEAYGSPEQEEIKNQHNFLHKATFDNSDTLKTTFLNEYELGRPDFTIRFLQGIKTIAQDLIDPIANDLEVVNGIALYFQDKIENITSSGMSNEGFTMKLNVTRKVDMTRKRYRENPIDNLKGGKKK